VWGKGMADRNSKCKGPVVETCCCVRKGQDLLGTHSWRALSL
jgi:hypothetical protein